MRGPCPRFCGPCLRGHNVCMQGQLRSRSTSRRRASGGGGPLALCSCLRGITAAPDADVRAVEQVCGEAGGAGVWIGGPGPFERKKVSGGALRDSPTVLGSDHAEHSQRHPASCRKNGLFRELNPGPLAPEARIMPLDQTANNGKKLTMGCLQS